MSINNQAEPSPHFTSSHLHHLNSIHNNYYTSLNHHHHHHIQQAQQTCKTAANSSSSTNNGTISQYILESNPAVPSSSYGSYVINNQPESTDCSKLTVKTESSMLKNESDMINKNTTTTTNNSPLTSPCSKMTANDDQNKSTCFSYLTSVTHSPPASSSAATDCSKIDNTTMSSMYDASSAAGMNGSGSQDSKTDPIIEYNPELAESIEYELGLKKQNGPRKNSWGNLSYAELITRAIESSPEKRLTLSQIYDWIIKYVPYFKEKYDRTSSAGWKNSIRHNLSLHNRFIRVQNESSGKSSWWMINPDVNKYSLNPSGLKSPSSLNDYDQQYASSSHLHMAPLHHHLHGYSVSSDIQLPSAAYHDPTGTNGMAITFPNLSSNGRKAGDENGLKLDMDHQIKMDHSDDMVVSMAKKFRRTDNLFDLDCKNAADEPESSKAKSRKLTHKSGAGSKLGSGGSGNKSKASSSAASSSKSSASKSIKMNKLNENNIHNISSQAVDSSSYSLTNPVSSSSSSSSLDHQASSSSNKSACNATLSSSSFSNTNSGNNNKPYLHQILVDSPISNASSASTSPPNFAQFYGSSTTNTSFNTCPSSSMNKNHQANNKCKSPQPHQQQSLNGYAAGYSTANRSTGAVNGIYASNSASMYGPVGTIYQPNISLDYNSSFVNGTGQMMCQQQAYQTAAVQPYQNQYMTIGCEDYYTNSSYSNGYMSPVTNKTNSQQQFNGCSKNGNLTTMKTQTQSMSNGTNMSAATNGSYCTANFYQQNGHVMDQSYISSAHQQASQQILYTNNYNSQSVSPPTSTSSLSSTSSYDLSGGSLTTTNGRTCSNNINSSTTLSSIMPSTCGSGSSSSSSSSTSSSLPSTPSSLVSSSNNMTTGGMTVSSASQNYEEMAFQELLMGGNIVGSSSSTTNCTSGGGFLSYSGHQILQTLDGSTNGTSNTLNPIQQQQQSISCYYS